MTMERASEIVSKVRELGESDMAIELFCHFEEQLNPCKDPESEECATWLQTFAMMCGYGIATNASKV